jgi:hypothetical protein
MQCPIACETTLTDETPRETTARMFAVNIHMSRLQFKRPVRILSPAQLELHLSYNVVVFFVHGSKDLVIVITDILEYTVA